MHHSHRQQELHAWLDTPEAAARRAASAPCMMQMTVDTARLTELRQLVTRICGDALEFMRIEACEHGTRMKIWLCVSRQLAAQVMEVALGVLPGAEFGRLACVQRDHGMRPGARVLS